MADTQPEIEFDKVTTDTSLVEDLGATRVISLDEQDKLNTVWQKTVDKDLSAAADVSGGTAGEKLLIDSLDTPELRSRLNNVKRRYQFLEQFTEGGFGIIHKARDRTLDRVVIIKSMRPEMLNDHAAVKKFIAEAKLNAQLDHPAIVPLYSLDTDDENGLHLAMKFIDGITLKDYIVRLKVKYNLNRISQAEERRSLRQRLEVFLKIGQAIEYSHSRDIIHCDLKPENVMIGAYGELFVMDWGTATHPGKNRKGAVEGTPSYLAPETLIDGTVTHHSDVFSLGMILFELVTLKRAVEGVTVNEIVAKIRAGLFESTEHYMPHLRIQPSLKAIIAKAIDINPHHRYQSVSELVEDVRHFMFHEEISARPDNLLQQIARRMYHHRVKSLMLVAVVIMIFASLATWSFYRLSVASDTASLKIFRHIGFQIATDQQGAAIDKYFLHIQNILQTFSSNLVLMLEHPPRQSYTGPIYTPADFRNPQKAPRDYVYSPAYRYRVSLGYPVYFTIPDSKPVNPDEQLRDLYQLRHLAKNLLIKSDPELRVMPTTRQQINTLLLQQGAPARRLFAILNNGLIINYPGTGNLSENANPTDWPWYKQAVTQRKTTWGSLYVDDSGNLMLPCAAPLLNTQGKILGISAIDMSFEYISNKLMNFKISGAGGAVEKYLVNDQGKVVVSSVMGRVGFVTGASPRLRSLRPFPYQSELEKLIREKNSRQTVITDNNRRLLLSYSPITSLDWYFVQVAEFDRIMNLSEQALDEAEQRTVDQFIEYRSENLPGQRLLKKFRGTTSESEEKPAPESEEENKSATPEKGAQEKSVPNPETPSPQNKSAAPEKPEASTINPKAIKGAGRG